MRDGMLEFKDAPMFGKVMRDPEICKGVLERILGFEIDRIEYLNTEQAFDPATDAKGVRLDVFAKDSERVYDVEMQIAMDTDLGKRLRYYQASVDHACLDKGDPYDALPENYVIFICDFDAYGYELPIYHFERRCLERDELGSGDLSHWLVLNASAWEAETDPGRSAMLEYVHTNVSASDGFIGLIEASVQQANADREWRKSAMGFMTVEHHRRATLNIATKKGLEQGMKQGLEQGREEAERRYSALIDALFDAGRVDDLKRAADDSSFRQSLLEEFHIV